MSSLQYKDARLCVVARTWLLYKCNSLAASPLEEYLNQPLEICSKNEQLDKVIIVINQKDNIIRAMRMANQVGPLICFLISC